MARRSVAPLLIGTFILRATSGAGTIILALLLAQIATSKIHPINSIQVGLLPIAFYVTELTFAPLMGGLSDRWGRRIFLIVAPLLGLVQVGLLLFTPTRNPLPYLLGLQILSGLSGAMSTPAVLGYLADFTASDQRRRMRIMSFYELVTSGGIATGTVLGGFIWERFGRWSFVLLASLYLVVSLCMLLAPVVNQVVDSVKYRFIVRRYLRILRIPRLLLFIPAWLCISALVGVWLSTQVPFLLSVPSRFPDQLMVGSMSGPGGSHRLSLVLGGYALFFGLCLLFWAFFLSRISRLRLMLISVVGIYLACIALAGINHRDPGNDAILLLWVPILLIGIFAETSFAPAALAYLADISEEAIKDRGLVMGLYSIFLGLGQILGNGLGGLFTHRFGFDGLIYLTVLLATVALLSLLWLFRQDRRYHYYGSSNRTDALVGRE